MVKRKALAALTAETVRAFHEVLLVDLFGYQAGLVPPEVIQGLLAAGYIDPAQMGGLQLEAGTEKLDPFLYLRMASNAMDAMSPEELRAARDWGIKDWAPVVAAQVEREKQQTAAELGGAVVAGAPEPLEDLQRPAPPEEGPAPPARSPAWLSPQQRAGHAEALGRAGAYARGLGNAYAEEGADLALEGWEGEEIREEVDPETRASMLEAIREETAASIAGPNDARKLARDLAERTGYYTHNWERIAKTELQGAHNAARVELAVDNHGPDAQIARITESNACVHCRRLFRDAEGLPVIFSAEELLENGTNVGLHPDDWKPTIWPIHPNCQCDTISVPKGFYVTSSGRIRKQKRKP